MEKIIINGGNNRLVGTVKIEGAKNAVLPLLAATVLASEGVTTLKNVPVLSDVYTCLLYTSSYGPLPWNQLMV